jgi:small-conductance mechanosensitive channel
MINLLIIFLTIAVPLFGQNEAGDKAYPVVLKKDTLFLIYNGIGTFNAEQRARAISDKLDKVIEAGTYNLDSITVFERGDDFYIALENELLFAVTPDDAEVYNTSADTLADTYRIMLSERLKVTSEEYRSDQLLYNILYSFLYLILIVLLIWGISFLFNWFAVQIATVEARRIKAIELKGKEIVKPSVIIKTLIFVAKGLKFALTLYIIYFFLVEIANIWFFTRTLNLQPFLKGTVYFIFFTVLFLTIVKSTKIGLKFLLYKYNLWKGTKIKSIKFRTIEIFSADRAVEVLSLLTKVFRVFLIVVLLYLYFTIIFSLFTFTSNWSAKLMNYLFEPVRLIADSILDFLPNLFFIVVIIFVFYYLIKAVKFFFKEIEKGTLEFENFHKDWAAPTYKIIRFMLIVLSVIIIFPYLPGSDSPFFRGISIFFGVLFSLGSTSAIANIVSGVVITYMRPFKIGDRVKIADTMGDVIEKTLLVTRVRTNKNIDITIPNAMVLGSHIVNYSSSSLEKGLILNTTVTIGYDVPWQKVHKALIKAAEETTDILKDHKPFVLQTSLNDFHVSYELNAFTDKPNHMAEVYSNLHSKIQDKFYEEGIEIMSPSYSSIRDGNKIAIPDENLPKNYEAPPFKLFGVNIFDQKKSE